VPFAAAAAAGPSPAAAAAASAAEAVSASCLAGAPAPEATGPGWGSASLSRSPAEALRRMTGRLASAAMAYVAARFISSLTALQGRYTQLCMSTHGTHADKVCQSCAYRGSFRCHRHLYC
jgi:hypothetical protein